MSRMGRVGGFTGAIRIRRASAGQWAGDVIPRGTQHLHANVFYGKAPALLNHDMGMSSDCLLVGGEVGARYFGVFEIGAVIDERSDLEAIHQLRNPADMVAMKVGDQHVVELLESRLMRGSDDAIGVAAFVSRPTAIDSWR